MSSRGRGYGRGSYNGGRGSGYRGNYRGGGSRGGYESRGGRGGGYSSYNNESRYNSGSGSRYNSSRDRMDDSYKKPYRSDNSANYSNRDYGGRSGSPERKRMRMEGSSSDRRSHDGGGHYGGSYAARQESYGERRSFGGEERRRSPARESYRKASGMGPPREAARSGVRPRRAFRGRALRSRAPFRGATRSRASFTTRRFGERQLGYTRTFRSVKGRSSIKSKEEASSTEEEWDADEKEEPVEDKKESKIKSPKVEEDASDGEAAEGEETDKEPDAASDAPPPRTRPYVNLVCVHCKEKCATFGTRYKKVSSLSATRNPLLNIGLPRGSSKRPVGSGLHPPFISLRDRIRNEEIRRRSKVAEIALRISNTYAKHLVSSRHRTAMSAVARRHKAQLLRMRIAQRAAQRELETAAGAELAARTTFCLVCRLNHRTSRHAHNLTDTHRAMKRFLMPFCRICHITFRSPMIYEHHICSLEHLKKKASQTVRRASPKPGSGDEGMDVDLDNFMTLDSVGDVDEVEDEDSGGEKKEEAAPKKPKVEINIGSEHIKKMEVWWCELCRVYLPRAEAGGAEEAEALRRHCRLRIHLGRYVQHRDTRTLRKHAERIHRQLHQQKEEEKDAASTESIDKTIVKTEVADENKKKVDNGVDANNVSGSEDKLWADVDKDIGELLREVDTQGNEGSDDEDDLDRYDKFRKSEKKTKAGSSGDRENEDTGLNSSGEKKNAEINSTT